MRNRFSTLTLILFITLLMALVIMPDVALAAKRVPLAPSGIPCKEFYFVKSGDTILSITRKFDIEPMVLVWLNAIKTPESIFPGDKLCVDYPVGAGKFYAVGAGDTLTKIAQRYNQQIYYLARVNNIDNADLIFQGQVLFIPKGKKLFR